MLLDRQRLPDTLWNVTPAHSGQLLARQRHGWIEASIGSTSFGKSTHPAKIALFPSYLVVICPQSVVAIKAIVAAVAVAVAAAGEVLVGVVVVGVAAAVAIALTVAGGAVVVVVIGVAVV